MMVGKEKKGKEKKEEPYIPINKDAEEKKTKGCLQHQQPRTLVTQ